VMCFDSVSAVVSAEANMNAVHVKASVSPAGAKMISSAQQRSMRSSRCDA
jgi:hypothetical protein